MVVKTVLVLLQAVWGIQQYLLGMLLLLESYLRKRAHSSKKTCRRILEWPRIPEGTKQLFGYMYFQSESLFVCFLVLNRTQTLDTKLWPLRCSQKFLVSSFGKM